MDVKLVVLVSCVTFAYCQKTISNRDEAGWQHEYFEDIRNEVESIRKLLMSQQKAEVCDERPTIQEMQSEIQDIRQIVSNQSQVLETLRDKWHEIAICPRGFTYLPLAGSCYKVVYESYNWTSAGKRCRELGRGSHLVAITSATENNAVNTFLASELSKSVDNTTCILDPWPFLGSVFWTSGQRQIEDSCRSPFVWKLSCDEELPVEYSNWVSGEPNCFSMEFCMNIWPENNFGWNDMQCDLKICPFCEYTT